VNEKPLKTFVVFLAILVSGFVVSMPGQDAQSVGTKIAFVNTTSVLQGTAEGKQELARMEEYVTEKQQALQSQTSELETLRQQYESQARMLNPDTAAEMQRTISEKDRALRRLQEDVQVEVDNRRTDVLNRMSEKIQAVITEYAEQNGYGAIFLESPALPFFAATLDITADIIRLYDERHPVAGAAPAETPAPAPQN
jgi:outer membrane protein